MTNSTFYVYWKILKTNPTVTISVYYRSLYKLIKNKKETRVLEENVLFQAGRNYKIEAENSLYHSKIKTNKI